MSKIEFFQLMSLWFKIYIPSRIQWEEPYKTRPSSPGFVIIAFLDPLKIKFSIPSTSILINEGISENILFSNRESNGNPLER